jgi:hypothetical protein
MRRGRRNLWMTLGTACNGGQRFEAVRLVDNAFLESGMNDSPPLRLAQCNLILARSNRLVSQHRPTRAEKHKFLLADGPFHCVRMGVERIPR